jgi:hypothetical protein
LKSEMRWYHELKWEQADVPPCIGDIYIAT